MNIYVLTEEGRDSPCKIGVADNPKHRASSLSTGSPLRLIVRHSEDCQLCKPEFGGSNPWWQVRKKARAVEKTIHRDLALFNLRGEWFDLDWKLAAAAVMQHVKAAKGIQA